MVLPTDVKVGLCEVAGRPDLQQIVLVATPTQVIWLVNAPPGVFFKPFVQNFTDSGIYVQICIGRIGAPYPMELLSPGSRLSVNHESLRREISKPDGRLVYEFTVWSLCFEGGEDLPLEIRTIPWGLIGHHTLIVVGPEHYHRLRPHYGVGD